MGSLLPTNDNNLLIDPRRGLSNGRCSHVICSEGDRDRTDNRIVGLII